MNEVVDRPLEAIAIENAVEGCVRETYGALVGAHQARAASDSAVRRIMKELSRDEIGHACLAWGVAEWAGTRLTPAERARVREARAEAVDQLRMEVDVEAEPDLVHLAGVPDATAARGLYSGLAREVWV
jgi:hypothetical protein